jgi:DNA-binding beta-propeller fold protein YncE
MSRYRRTAAILAFATLALLTNSGAAAQPRGAARLPHGVVASIKLGVGVAPLSVVSAFGSIWVSSHRATDLYRINPTNNHVVATIDIGQVSCGPIAAGLGQIWVTPCSDTLTLVRVAARTNRVVGRIHPTGIQVAFGARSAWLANTILGHGSIERISRSGKLQARIPVGSGPSAVAFGDGYVWNVNGDDGTLDKIDPKTNKVIARVRFVPPNSYGYLFFFAGRVWLSSGVAAAPTTWLANYDPKTRKTHTLRVRGKQLSQFGDQLATMGLGSLWIRTSNGIVSRIDPQTGGVLGSYPADADGGGGFLAVGHGALWIANFASDTIWRDRI